MLDLMRGVYDGVSAESFGADLDGKDRALLLLDETSGEIEGFTTLARQETFVSGEPVVALFSGDTVVTPSRWGSRELPRAWGRLAFSLAAREEGRRVFWLLICAGHRTYRFLPIFFRDFVPSATRRPSPALLRLRDALAAARFGARYDAASGIVRLASPTPVRAELAEPGLSALADPDVAFFLAANPGFSKGDELACLAELSPSNLTPVGRRLAGL